MRRHAWLWIGLWGCDGGDDTDVVDTDTDLPAEDTDDRDVPDTDDTDVAQGPCPVETIAWDYGDDGGVDDYHTYAYDELWRVEVFDVWDMQGGFVGSRSTHVYQDDGRLAEVRIEYGPDMTGVVDLRATYTYDDEARTARAEVDAGDDGSVETTIDWTFDAEDRQTSQRQDASGYVDRFEWTYDDADRVVTESWDLGDDGAIEWVRAFTYGDHAQPLTITTDLAGDGAIDQTDGYAYAYDDGGRVTEEAQDINDDGSVELRTTYAYDERGDLALTLQDDADDGSTDTRIVTTTVCTPDP